MLEKGIKQLVPRLIPIYKEYLTETEVDGIIKFYESDLGKSLVEKTPLIMNDAMAVGAQWGDELGQEIGKIVNESNIINFTKDPVEDCSIFKEGTFTAINSTGARYSFVRKGDHQIETSDNNSFKYKIKWNSNNKYSLIDLDANNKEVFESEVVVNIYEVNGNTYKYICKALNGIKFYRGEITKVE
jgi:hypothetical protein